MKYWFHFFSDLTREMCITWRLYAGKLLILVLWKLTKKVSLMVEASIIYFDLSHSGILFMNTPKCKKLCFVFRYEQFLEWEEDAIWHNTIFMPDCIPQNVKLDGNRCGKTRICTFGLPKIFSHYKLYSYQQIVLHL